MVITDFLGKPNQPKALSLFVDWLFHPRHPYRGISTAIKSRKTKHKSEFSLFSYCLFTLPANFTKMLTDRSPGF